jgi:uncharacterized membrane protein
MARRQKRKGHNKTVARKRNNNQPNDDARLIVRETLLQKIEKWSGPIPPPDHLRAYEDVAPGLATRIVVMTEAQTTHRIKIEALVVTGDSRRAWGGLVIGGILGLAGIVGGVAISIYGNPWFGASFFVIDIAGLAGIFVYGTERRQTAREKQTTTF